MRKTIFVLMLLVLVFAPVGQVLADDEPVTVDAYVSDGIISGTEITTDRAFSVGIAIYHLLEGFPRATVIFEEFPPEWNPTFNQGTGLAGTVEYSDSELSYTWDGDLMGSGTASELWVHVSDNLFFEQTVTFTISVLVDGQDPVVKQVSVTNPNPPPPPPVPVINANAWVTDGISSGEAISSVGPFTTGVAIYQDQKEAVPATITLSNYPSECDPSFHVGSTVVGTYSLVNGEYTWVGQLNANAATEMWVDVASNVFYNQTVDFTIEIVAEGAETVVKTLSVTNTEEPPPPPPTVYNVFLPLVLNGEVESALEDIPVSLDVSASDGTLSSNTVLTTDKSFAVNLAIYPRESVTEPVTITFSGFQLSWGTEIFGLPGVTNFDALLGAWIWTGNINPDTSVSEFWVNVPDNQLHGQQIFTVTVKQEGKNDVSSQVTVISP